MKKSLVICLTCLAVSLLSSADLEGNKTASLTIKWQRLVCTKGETCERCDLTSAEVLKAHQLLKDALTVLGVQVLLDEKSIDPASFAKNPLESNRIWIGDKPLEEWLGAKVGKSSCVTCSDVTAKPVQCRTIKYQGQTYETVPAALIVKAGLIAAAQTIKVGASKPCCADQAPGKPCEGCPKK